MLEAFLAGAAAGYGIAIPVGAIAILIIETGLRRGFRLAAAAGAGAATVDGIYAAVAAVFGAVLATVLAPFVTPLRVLAVAVLAAIAVHGLLGVRSTLAAPDPEAGTIRPDVEKAGRDGTAGPDEAAERDGAAARTYLAFLAITLLNPLTLTYFAALILGLAQTGAGPAEKAAFVLGAFLASLSWQTLLAAAGAFLHRRLSPRLRVGVIVLGNAIILAFAAVIAVGLMA